MFSLSAMAVAFNQPRCLANQDDVVAKSLLGGLYYQGKGVLQDFTIPKEWNGKACDSGEQFGCDIYRELNK
ncbi:hypothetical protein [Psychrobacter sp.]|uniref:hypothetical protein n=1 Tax=Psychrobacter sp. TaxID=56811 RepID=UPI003C746A48